MSDEDKEKIKTEIIEMCITISDHCFKDDYDESELIEVHKHLNEII